MVKVSGDVYKGYAAHAYAVCFKEAWVATDFASVDFLEGIPCRYSGSTEGQTHNNDYL